MNEKELSPAHRAQVEAHLREYEVRLTPAQREMFNYKKMKYANHYSEKDMKVNQDFNDRVTDIIYQQIPIIASLTKELLTLRTDRARVKLLLIWLINIEEEVL